MRLSRWSGHGEIVSVIYIWSQYFLNEPKSHYQPATYRETRGQSECWEISTLLPHNMCDSDCDCYLKMYIFFPHLHHLSRGLRCNTVISSSDTFGNAQERRDAAKRKSHFSPGSPFGPFTPAPAMFSACFLTCVRLILFNYNNGNLFYTRTYILLLPVTQTAFMNHTNTHDGIKGAAQLSSSWRRLQLSRPFPRLPKLIHVTFSSVKGIL